MFRIKPIISVVEGCRIRLEVDGFSIEETDDYKAAVQSLRNVGKPYLTPNMSPEFNDFTSQTGFWILLKHQGSIIGGIAARLDRLGSETLGQFWERTNARLYGDGSAPQTQTLSEFVSKDVSGDITYFGDLILSKEYRGYGAHLRLFTMYCQMFTALLWDSDWQYSFISEARAETGGAFTYGFSKTIPGAQLWLHKQEKRRSSECCVISSRADVVDLATYYSRNLSKLRELPKVPKNLEPPVHRLKA